MPLTDMNFVSGLVKDDTALTAKGGCVDANNIRFRQGKPEPRGGWEMVSTVPFVGIPRGAKEWSDLRGQPQAAWGTQDNAYVLSGGAIIDITGPFIEGTALNPFTTVSGSPTVTVRITENGLRPDQSITFSNGAAVGGLTLNGTYKVATLISRDSFTITAASNATSTVTTPAGGGVDFTATFPPGAVNGTGGIGFGTGTYGTGPYGQPSAMDYLPTVWSLDNFGETLLANRRGGPLQIWQPALSYADIIRDSAFAGGTGWSTATRGGTKTAGTAANLSQNIQNVAQGGQVMRVRFTVSGMSAGSIKIQVNAGAPTPALIDVGSASTAITQNGTYSRLIVMPAKPSDIVFAADSAWAGTITVTKLSLEDKLTTVVEAPRRIDSMFVDPHGPVCVFGTYEADGDYNPLLIRWSDLSNYRTWVPDTNVFAGEIAVATGGRIVGALPSRNSNLVWTDGGLHGMQFASDGFSVSLIATGCGLIGRHAATEHNGIAYWWAKNGNRYRTTFDFQGTIPQLIDCRIQSDADRVAISQDEKIFACVNTRFSEVQWFYPDDRLGTECNRALVYQFTENHWTSWDEARSSWVSGSVYESPIGFGTDGYLYYHERGITANGNALPNWLRTAYFNIESGGNLMALMGLVYDFLNRIGPITFRVYTKPFPHGSETAHGPFTTSMSETPGSYRDQKIDLRITARQMAFSIEAETPWRLGVVGANARKSGAVR